LEIGFKRFLRKKHHLIFVKTLMRPVFEETITITFGDQCENYVGMEKIGKMAKEGFSVDDLKKAKALFEAGGAVCELVNLNDALAGVDHGADEPAAAAGILIIRGGVSALLQKSGKTADEAFEEQKCLL
jgi:hypothetical protein